MIILTRFIPKFNNIIAKSTSSRMHTRCQYQGWSDLALEADLPEGRNPSGGRYLPPPEGIWDQAARHEATSYPLQRTWDRVPTDQVNQGKQGKFRKLFPIREKQVFFSQNQGKKFKSGKFSNSG